MGGVQLSFCIPTFNRAELVRKCVNHILSSDSDEIEVVVSDNNSTDHTKQLLEAISDHRFKYIFNDEIHADPKYSFGNNLINVLGHASGEFAFVLSDEDEVILDSIAVILETIHTCPDCSLIFGRVRNSIYQYRTGYHARGADLLIHYGFEHTYLSGIIFKRQNVPLLHNIYNNNFPHIILTGILCTTGDLVTLEQEICIAGPPLGRSVPEDVVFLSAWFDPQSRAKQFQDFITQVVFAGGLTKEEQVDVIVFLFLKFLYFSSWGYIAALNSEHRTYFHYRTGDNITVDFVKVFNGFVNHAMDFLNECLADKGLFKDVEKNTTLLRNLFLLSDQTDFEHHGRILIHESELSPVALQNIIYWLNGSLLNIAAAQNNTFKPSLHESILREKRLADLYQQKNYKQILRYHSIDHSVFYFYTALSYRALGENATAAVYFGKFIDAFETSTSLIANAFSLNYVLFAYQYLSEHYVTVKEYAIAKIYLEKYAAFMSDCESYFF